jgi:hypothetical protein
MREPDPCILATGCAKAAYVVLNDLSGPFIREYKIHNHEPTPALVLPNIFHFEMGLANIGAQLRLKPHFCKKCAGKLEMTPPRAFSPLLLPGYIRSSVSNYRLKSQENYWTRAFFLKSANLVKKADNRR